MTSFQFIETDRVGTDERVGRITLNRPEKMNALSQELLYELNEALHDMEADHTVRVITVSYGCVRLRLRLPELESSHIQH